MSLALYQIANDYQQALVKFEEGMDFDDINEALEELTNIEKSAEEKVIAVASFIKNLEAERKAIEEAKKSMAKREERLDKKVEIITEYLRSNMQRCGITEVKSSPYFTIKLKKNPESVDVYNEEIIPEEFKYTKTNILVDRMKLKSELQNGVVIEGACLKQNYRLEIK
jgi:hypothetical protein